MSNFTRYTFQFHYGSIKMTLHFYLDDYRFCFNSTMVRLKYYLRICFTYNRQTMFQFHYGSIKIKSDASYYVTSPQGFQFHYGSIKIRERCLLRWFDCCFNSTMVRLKWYSSTRPIFHRIKFQFHYGSIKILWCFCCRSNSSLFQFHYGSIKITLYPFFDDNKDSFNSTMVRLKFESYNFKRFVE